MSNDRDHKRLTRAEELKRLDREVTGDAVNARTDDTRRVTQSDAERMQRKYAGDNGDRSER